MNTVRMALVFVLVSILSAFSLAGVPQNGNPALEPVRFRYIDDNGNKELYLRIFPLVKNHSVITMMYYGLEGESGVPAGTISITAHNMRGTGVDWFKHEMSTSYGEHHRFICFKGDAYRSGPGNMLGKKITPFRDDDYGFSDSNGLHLNTGSALKRVFEELNRIERQWREGKTDFTDELEKVESYVYLINLYPDQYQLKDL